MQFFANLTVFMIFYVALMTFPLAIVVAHRLMALIEGVYSFVLRPSPQRRRESVVLHPAEANAGQ